MDASKTSMNTVSRRTRSQWDIFYRNRYNEVKGINTQESGETSVEKQDFGINGGNTGGVEIIEQDEGTGTRDLKRIRKKVSKISGSGDIGETAKQLVAEDAKNNNLAGVRMRLRSRKKFDMRAKNDDDAGKGDDDAGKGDDEVIYLGEEVVSNGLSSKVGSESRSGPHSKLSSVDEIVSCSSKQVEETTLITYQLKNSVVRGRGRSGIKHLNERRLDEASINLENAVGSDNSAMKLDGSDTAAESWLYGPDSSSKDDSSDEDYKEIEPSGSDGLHVSHCSSDAERKEGDEYEVGDDDDDSIKINSDPGEENSSNSIENKKTFILGTKIVKVKGKKENEVEHVKDNENNEGCDGDGNDNSSIRINSDRKTMENIVIIMDDEEPDLRKSARMNGKRDDELARINRLHKHCSNYISMDGARKFKDSSVSLGPTSASEREDDTVIVTDLKKRKTSDFDVCLDFDKHNKNRHGSITKHLQSRLISKSQKKKK